MLKPCLICYRLSTSQDNQKEILQNVPKTLNIFFKLLARHLRLDVGKFPQSADDDGLETGWEVPLETVINVGVNCCGDCSKVVESFCELYHKMKSIELQLNWKLGRLKNIMSSAQKADGRMADFKAWTSEQIVDVGDGIGVNETIRMVLDFKQDLINKCGSKLQTTFPKLNVLKCEYKEEMVEEPFSNNASSSDLAGYHRDKIGSINSDNDSIDIPEQHLVKSEGIILSASTIGSNFSTPSKTKKTLADVDKGSDVVKVKSKQELPTGELQQEPCSRFRTIHRCQKCMKTFSTPRKLVAHQQRCHKNDDESAELSSSSDEEEEGASEFDDQLVRDDDAASIYSVENDQNQTDEMDLSLVPLKCSEDFKATDPTMKSLGEKRKKSKEKKTKVKVKGNYVPSKHAWKSHYTFNNETSKYQCNICSNEFSTQRGFQFHYSSIHLKVRFECTKCKKEFRSISIYNRHHRDVHLVLRRFECPVCHQSFKRIHHLKRHRSRTCRKISDSEPTNLIHVDKNPAVDIKIEFSAMTSNSHDLYGNNQHLDIDNAGQPLPMSGESENNDIAKGDALHEQSNMIILSESPKQMDKTTLQNSLNPRTGKYNCDLCSNEFTTRSGLSTHYKTIHLKRRFKCGLCGKRFNQRFNYRRHHENVHRNVGSFTCGICNQKFKQRYYLYNHAKTGSCKSLHLDTKEDQDGPGNSEHGHTQSPEAKLAVETLASPSVIENSSCPKEIWKQHCITDSKTGRTKCSICPKEFKTSSGFLWHYESFHLKKTFQCTLCNQDFRSQSIYNRHHRDVHLRLKSFKCSNCNRTFKRSHHLARHKRTTSCRNNPVNIGKESLERTELTTKEHVCSHCGKNFVTIAKLKNHVKIIHSQPTEFICEHCGKKFNRRNDLTRHLKRIHQTTKTDKKVVTKKLEKAMCEECGKVFSSPGNLRVHVQNVHLKLKLREQSACDQCGKVLDSQSLVTHMKYVHWNMRNYACEFCDKKFVKTNDLKRHLKSMHPDPSEFN